MNRSIPIAVLSVALALNAHAQRAAAGAGVHAAAPAVRPSVPRFNRITGSFGVGRNAYAARFNRYAPYGGLLWPFAGDLYDLTDLYSSGYPVAAEPPLAFLQAAAGGTMGSPYRRADSEASPAEPLMIELQGDRYVHVNGKAADGEALPLSVPQPAPGKLSRDNSGHLSTPDSMTSAQTAAASLAQLPAAILVFRDGHSEEVRDYTIADGMLYAHGDLYADGYWNKKIDLASLNLPETLHANATRNVNFVLPSSPNEVIARF